MESYPAFVPWCVSAKDISLSWIVGKDIYSASDDEWDSVKYMEMSAGFKLIHDRYVSEVRTKGTCNIKVCFKHSIDRISHIYASIKIIRTKKSLLIHVMETQPLSSSLYRMPFNSR